MPIKASITTTFCTAFVTVALPVHAAVTIDIDFEDGTGHTNTIASNH